MKVIIAGSRSITDMQCVIFAIEKSGFNITEVVSGTAKGVDTLGEKWALDNCIKVKKFPANWRKYGNHAGGRRNFQMAEYADALIAVWDGRSNGTKNMINHAENLGIKVYKHTILRSVK